MKFPLQIIILIGLLGLTSLKGAVMPDVLDYPTIIQLAREHNFGIQQAEAQLQEAEGRTMSARAARKPYVDLLAGYSRVDKNRLENFGDTAFGDSQSWNADIRATQPIYTGGAVNASIQAANASLLSNRTWSTVGI